jgi:thiol:disulfide interchange protein DsbD
MLGVCAVFGNSSIIWGNQAGELLDPAVAFVLTTTSADSGAISVEWSIADGYYLYRDRIDIASATPGIAIGSIRKPPGLDQEDLILGRTQVYRDSATIGVALLGVDGNAPNLVRLQVTSQGCADIGVCFPPQRQSVTVALSQPRDTDLFAKTDNADSWLFDARPEDALLDSDQAFIPTATVTGPSTVTATWTIAEGYYLYRDKLRLSFGNDTPLIRVSELSIPKGTPIEDEFFGRQEVFFQSAEATARLQGSWPGGELNLKLSYQGCAEIGVCYPPMSQEISVELAAFDIPLEPSMIPSTAISDPPASTAAPVDSSASIGIASSDANEVEMEQDRMARMLVEQRFWAIPAFFGFGLLLAFTPCVFPMIPILSSIIVGQGETLTHRRAFVLSLVYVLAMAATYTLAGILAALAGQNVQALFQNTWVLASFSTLFVLLALSMFGFYDLQLPSRWQSRLAELSNRQGGGTYVGVAVMGLLSALIVGPCVAPPLIGVLTVIAATGDTALGGVALFALSLGMGVPLLIIGASAGKLLPCAGRWMNAVKAVFGVLLLAVAIWLLERILPPEISMLLWSMLLIVSATYMGAFRTLTKEISAWHMLTKGLGVVLLVYGILLLVGVAAGGKDTLQPLRGTGLFAETEQAPAPLTFEPVKTPEDLDRALARARGQTVMLDFYADWCVSCKELEKYTFPATGVRNALATMRLLKADVTANDSDDQALMQRFGIIGPPALLFFDGNGAELRSYRVVGFMPAEDFEAHLARALKQAGTTSEVARRGTEAP